VLTESREALRLVLLLLLLVVVVPVTAALLNLVQAMVSCLVDVAADE
jgi:hypothetical protein